MLALPIGGFLFAQISQKWQKTIFYKKASFEPK